MRRLKALVATMTLLIFAAFGLLAYGLAAKTGAAPRDAAITLPEKSDVKLMAGYKDSLALYVAAPGGDWIYFYDPKKGAVTGRVQVRK